MKAAAGYIDEKPPINQNALLYVLWMLKIWN